MSLLKIKKHTGEPFQAGDVEITPVSRSFTLKPPGRSTAVLSRVRPEAIRVNRSGGPEYMLRVPDRTRRAQLMVVALHIASVFLISNMIKLISRRKR